MTEYLWKKGEASEPPDAAVQRFLCGDDRVWDTLLLPYDLQASAAHVRGLERIGILSAAESQQLCQALQAIGHEFARGERRLEPPVEDGHSAIEIWLTERLGESGRKVHTGRSRNDQVQVALRLYLLEALARLAETAGEIGQICLQRARQPGPAPMPGPTPMPGYTHLQRAVPSSLEFWFAGYAEAFIDLLPLAAATRHWISALPLGTAAGFGVNLPLDREGLRRDLGFERIQLNPQYVQNSRGRFELQVLTCLAQATLELRRLAWDLSLFACQEFQFVRLPSRFTTGSSIMPNKRNPDVVELLRGQHAVVQGSLAELQGILSLPAGYHRDLQLTKGPTLRALESSLGALALVPQLLLAVEFDPERMRQAISPEMYATDLAVERAQQGVPFRDAYRAPLAPQDLAARTPEQSLAARVSLGGCGNLGLAELQQRLDGYRGELHGR